MGRVIQMRSPLIPVAFWKAALIGEIGADGPDEGRAIRLETVVERLAHEGIQGTAGRKAGTSASKEAG